METTETPAAPASTAVQLAELTGMVRQVVSDHERRLTALEARAAGAGTRAAAIWGPVVAGCALVITVAGKLPWQ